MIIERDRIRMRLDSQTDGVTGATDLVTGESPRAWRGTDFQFELAFAFQGALVTPSNFDSITITVKDAKDRRGPKLMEKIMSAADINTDLEEAQWTAGTHQHVTVPFTAAETALDLGNADEKEFFLSVIGITAAGRRVPLGTAKFTLEDDGTSGSDITPPLGSSIVPLGQAYSGAGSYILTTEAGKTYYWIKGANDTSISNGTQTLTASGYISSIGTTLTMVGTASALISALVRWPGILIAEETYALVAGLGKIILPAGVLRGEVSQNGRWLRLTGVDNDGRRIDKVKDLTL
ncbi:MAG TPA: hypothetical protein VM680_18655 [Verrucomicrobiae bacterium]|nr:hypothetical protein [Verrucomicrobiae bacterium]